MLDAAQLALAPGQERERALANEAKWRAREAARVAREAALSGDPAAALALRAAFRPLERGVAVSEQPVREGVVIND